MTQQTQIVKIDPKEFGLEEVQGQEISNAFQPMLDKMSEMESEYNYVISLPEDSDEAEAKATELIRKYVKTRTASDLIHASKKSYFLNGGRFCDKWKNLQHEYSEERESKLREIKDRKKILEAKMIGELNSERCSMISAYEINGSLMSLGNMSEDVWTNYLSGVKMNYEAKKEAERKAEETRIENERLDKREQERRMEISEYKGLVPFPEDLRNMNSSDFGNFLIRCLKIKSDYEKEQEKIRLENESLKKAAEEKEKQLEAERQAAAQLKAKADAEAKKAKELSDAKIKAEKDKADALAAQLKAKADAEEAERKQEAAALKKAQAAPDKEKLKLLAKRLTETEFPLVKTKEANDIIAQVEILLNKTAEYINQKILSL